jgi:hypothetical protein
MNCKIYQCDKTAEHPYPCCGVNHGSKLKEIKELLEAEKRGDLLGYGQGKLAELTPEELTYYKSIN